MYVMIVLCCAVAMLNYLTVHSLHYHMIWCQSDSFAVSNHHCILWFIWHLIRYHRGDWLGCSPTIPWFPCTDPTHGLSSPPWWKSLRFTLSNGVPIWSFLAFSNCFLICSIWAIKSVDCRLATKPAQQKYSCPVAPSLRDFVSINCWNLKRTTIRAVTSSWFQDGPRGCPETAGSVCTSTSDRDGWKS